MNTKISDDLLVQGLNDSARIIHKEAKKKGFWNHERNKGELLMLVVSELGEALEADRKNRYAQKHNMQQYINEKNSYEYTKDLIQIFERDIKDTFEDEIADAIIRLLDLSAGLGIDLEWHIRNKFNYNQTREKFHGKSY